MERGSLMLNTTTFCRPDARALDKGRRPRRDDRRGPLGHSPSPYDAAAVAEWVGSPRPCREVRLRVGRDRVRPAEEAHGAGRRLRRRRGLEDDRHRPTARGRTTATTRSSWRACCRSATSWRYACPDDERGARPGARAGRRARGPEALQAAAVEVPDAARIRVQRGDPDRAQEGQLDRRALGVDKVDRVSREGRRRRPRVLRRCRQTGDGGQEEAGEAGRGRGVQAPMEEEGRLAALPEGRRLP